MVELLWIDLFALTVGSAVAVLDLDLQIGHRRIGRPLYGVLVLGGLLVAYVHVLRAGVLPLPAFGVLAFALLYLPFLSQSFIDLELTDRVARRELERLLLGRDFRELRHAFGEDTLLEGRRRLRVRWEAREEGEGISLELDVHPSLLPLTVSRPHVATIRNQRHLERIRNDIRRRRASGE